MPTQLLVDGYSLMFRAFHALPATLSLPDGTPTGAVYGFCTMLLKAVEDTQPDRVVVVFDTEQPTFRHLAYAQYKATREAAPDAFRAQIPLVQELLHQLGMASVGADGYEADDVIGTLAALGTARGYASLILTGDRDLLQLVRPPVKVLLMARTGITEMEVLGEDEVASRMGVRPEQIPDLKGLMGDASDNIPGVPGIGQKTALKLIQRWGSIEEVYRHLDAIAETRVRAALAAHEATAFESKRLATIRCDAPVTWPELPEPYRIPKTPALAAWLDRMAFESIKRRLFGRVDPVPLAEEPAAVEAVDPGTVVWDSIPRATLAPVLGPPYPIWLEDGRGVLWPHDPLPPVRSWVGWDVKPVVRRALTLGWTLPEVVDDGALQAYLLDSEAGDYRLGRVAQRLGLGPVGEGLGQARLVHAVVAAQTPRLEAAGLMPLYRDVELPLMRVLAKMEAVGVRVDREGLRRLGEESFQALRDLEAEIYALAKGPFNLNSPRQLGEVLFERLGLPTVKRTKTGYSTDAETLETLAALHPVVEKILLWRQLTKVKGTYVDGLLPLVGPDGRLHTTFHQTVAATGRLSSSDPNLQNIPVRLPIGRRVRAMFLPSPGRELVAADYSQIELRMLAHLSGDEGLIQAFVEGEDIHRRTAAEIFGLPLDAVDTTWRNRAKAVNFGIVYGISDFGLARDTGVTRAEAAEYIRQYFARYPKVKQYLDAVVEEARGRGYVTTILGRRRPLPDIRDRNRTRRQMAERMAMNTVVQGSAADLIKLAMVAVDRAMVAAGLKSHLILQVHDELIWDAAPEELDQLTALADRAMTGALPLNVPLQVEFKRGPNWEALQAFAPREVS
ncbi:MAG: DNA polymerase I [Firmicutes bacterium]|nr:DNA polymerase I [Alicyclobacillaceae bacterium]MCL6496552.1 DNA polymerase I [Bacillota bacterium]